MSFQILEQQHHLSKPCVSDQIMATQSVEAFLLPFYAVVVVTGICGNFLFIVVVRRKRSMQTAINFMLGNVAISDIISLIFCVPGIMLRFFQHPRGIVGTFLCKFVTMHHIAGISLLVSGLTLTLISVDRHNALLRPMDTSLRLNRRPTKILISLIWGFSFAFVLPLFIFQKFVENIQNCQLVWDHTAAASYWACLATVVGFSLSTMCLCYFRILKAIYFKNILPPNNGNRLGQDNKDRRKIIKLLATVTTLFVVCFLPYVVVSASGISTDSVVYQVSYFLVYCSCCANPGVYVFQSENYRAGLKELWPKRSADQPGRSIKLRPHACIESQLKEQNLIHINVISNG